MKEILIKSTYEIGDFRGIIQRISGKLGRPNSERSARSPVLLPWQTSFHEGFTRYNLHFDGKLCHWHPCEIPYSISLKQQVCEQKDGQIGWKINIPFILRPVSCYISQLNQPVAVNLPVTIFLRRQSIVVGATIYEKGIRICPCSPQFGPPENSLEFRMSVKGLQLVCALI